MKRASRCLRTLQQRAATTRQRTEDACLLWGDSEGQEVFVRQNSTLDVKSTSVAPASPPVLFTVYDTYDPHVMQEETTIL
jgi:hypothetical protein